MTVAPSIQFGTAGWRGVIGQDFTFATVRQMTYALTRWWQERDWPRSVVVGFDSRFLSERFAEECAAVFARYQFEVYFTHRDTPHPALSWFVRSRSFPLGLNFTGSHNPPHFSGVKFIDVRGALLPDRVARELESWYTRWRRHRIIAFTYDEGLIRSFDPRDEYLTSLHDILDVTAFDRKLRVVIDPLYGTAREYLDGFLARFPALEIELLHSFKDPYFGGYGPDATLENVQELVHLVREGAFDLGLATDGDGDRFGIVDRGGRYVPPDQVLAIFYDYLLRVRGQRGGVVRNVATTHLLDRIARDHGFPVVQTPIGFKNMADYLWQDDILIAVEESSGFTMRPHIPDKDGILACLLAAEIVARTGQSLQAYWRDLTRRYGVLHQAKATCACTDNSMESFYRLLQAPPDRINHEPVDRIETTDGIKFYLPDDTWLLIRQAGTEPVLRVYSEAPNRQRAQHLARYAIQLLQGVSAP